MGETPQKTGAVIENCRGKVLLIDEAYALNDAHHGREALDTLVGKVGRRMGRRDTSRPGMEVTRPTLKNRIGARAF